VPAFGNTSEELTFKIKIQEVTACLIKDKKVLLLMVYLTTPLSHLNLM
jgi:hypothetical protein